MYHVQACAVNNDVYYVSVCSCQMQSTFPSRVLAFSSSRFAGTESCFMSLESWNRDVCTRVKWPFSVQPTLNDLAHVFPLSFFPFDRGLFPKGWRCL